MKILDGERLLADFGLDRLKSGSSFGAMSDRAICFLMTRGNIISLTDGEEVFHPGDAGDSLYVVLEGQLDYSRPSDRPDDDTEVLIRSVKFGEEIGYVSMIGLYQRIGYARAHGETVLLQLTSDLFYQLHLDLPFDFGILMLNLSRDMARTIRKITANFIGASIGHAVA